MSSVARLLLAGRTRGFVGSSATRMVGHAGSNAAQPAPRVFKRPFSFGNRPITEIRVLEYAALEQTYLSWIMLGLGIVGGSLILDSLASNQASAELIAVHTLYCYLGVWTGSLSLIYTTGRYFAGLSRLHRGLVRPTGLAPVGVMCFGGAGAYFALVLVNWLPPNQFMAVMQTERADWQTVMMSSARPGERRVLSEKAACDEGIVRVVRDIFS